MPKTLIAMKKALYFFGATITVLLSLSSCNKELENPDENIIDKKEATFELTASPVSTKTTNDGLDTKWAANDGVNVFHSVSGVSDYVSDGEFTIAAADLEANNFKGDLSEPLEETEYDWFMVYPYSNYLKTPTNDGENPARYYIGSRSDQSQIQEGNNNMAHLAGTNYPLIGSLTGINYDEKPNIPVDHVASYLEIKVTNKNDIPLTVETVTFTAPNGEKIVGQFNINFVSKTFDMYNNYASEVASLSVENGTEIAKDETASFFLGIKPFSLESGVLKVSVNGYEKEITIDKKTTFTAGKIKKINFAYDEDLTPATDFEWNLVTSVDQIVPGAEVVIAAKDEAMAMSQKQNENNRSQAAIAKSNSQISWEEGSLVQVFEIVTGKGDNTFAFKCKDGEQKGKYIYGGLTNNYLRTKTEIDANSSWTISVNDSGVATIKSSATGDGVRTWLRYNSSNSIFSCYASGQGDVALYIKGEAADPNAQAIISNGTVSVPAVGGDVNFEGAYSLKNIDEETDIIKLTASDNIQNSVALNGKVSFSMDPNYTSNKVFGSITLALESDDNVTATIPVEQKASSLKVSATEIVIPEDATSASFTVTSPEFGWNIVADESSDVEFTQSGEASESAIIVTVSSDVVATQEVQTIATLSVSRTEGDPQTKTVVIKKAEKSGDEKVYYKRVSTITSGGKYIIVGGDTSKALIPATGSNRKNSADVTISTEGILSNSTVDKYAVTITANGNNYDITFVSEGTTYYLTYGSSTNLATPTSTEKTWIVTEGTYGTFRFADSSTAGDPTKRGLIFRGGSTNQFGGYSLANVNGTEYLDIDLYEYQGE